MRSMYCRRSYSYWLAPSVKARSTTSKNRARDAWSPGPFGQESRRCSSASPPANRRSREVSLLVNSVVTDLGNLQSVSATSAHRFSIASRDSRPWRFVAVLPCVYSSKADSEIVQSCACAVMAVVKRTVRNAETACLILGHQPRSRSIPARPSCFRPPAGLVIRLGDARLD